VSISTLFDLFEHEFASCFHIKYYIQHGAVGSHDCLFYSFLHHFFPAYDTSITDYAAKVKHQAKMDEARKNVSFKTLKTKQS